jgi:hypothetical protein
MKTLEEIAEEFLITQGCQRMDCDGENCNFFEDVQPKDLIEFAKWQQEGSYSEEDMVSFAEFIAKYPDKNRNHSGQMLHAKSKYDGAERTIDLLQVWFEKFKKK